MDFRTWIVRVDHHTPVHDFEEPILAAIGDESEMGEAARRYKVGQSALLSLTGGLRKRGILKVENRDFPGKAGVS
jgi:hypothetical protein